MVEVGWRPEGRVLYLQFSFLCQIPDDEDESDDIMIVEPPAHLPPAPSLAATAAAVAVALVPQGDPVVRNDLFYFYFIFFARATV